METSICVTAQSRRPDGGRVRGRRAVIAAFAAMALTATSAVAASAKPRTLIVDNNYSFLVGQYTDPARAGVTPDAELYYHAVYQSLLTYGVGDTKTPQSMIAQSYKDSDGGRTWTFNLRRDVRFSDGTPLTAADVVFTFKRVLNLHAIPSYLLDGVTSMSAPGPYTFVLTTKNPEPAIPAIVTSPALGIVNSALLKAHGGTDAPNAVKTDTATKFLETTSAGSGPYVLVSANTSETVLRVSPNYWGKTKPAFARVIYRSNVPASIQAINARRAKDEIELSLTSDQAASLTHDKNLRVQAFTSANLYYLWVNKKNPLGSNSSCLDAIKHAIDYARLAAVAGAGSRQAPGAVPPAFLGALPSPTLHFDLQTAKQEMQRCPIHHPRITLDYVVHGAGVSTALASIVKADLREIGINVSLIGGPGAVAKPRYRSGNDPMALLVWYPDYSDPADYLAFLPGQLVGVHAGWEKGADPKIDALGVEASAATDAELRSKLFQELQTSLNRRGPIISLVNPGKVLVSTRNLTNVVLNPAWLVDVAAVGSEE